MTHFPLQITEVEEFSLPCISGGDELIDGVGSLFLCSVFYLILFGEGWMLASWFSFVFILLWGVCSVLFCYSFS